jgi:hypothetical protein
LGGATCIDVDDYSKDNFDKLCGMFFILSYYVKCRSAEKIDVVINELVDGVPSGVNISREDLSNKNLSKSIFVDTATAYTASFDVANTVFVVDGNHYVYDYPRERKKERLSIFEDLQAKGITITSENVATMKTIHAPLKIISGADLAIYLAKGYVHLTNTSEMKPVIYWERKLIGEPIQTAAFKTLNKFMSGLSEVVAPGGFMANMAILQEMRSATLEVGKSVFKGEKTGADSDITINTYGVQGKVTLKQHAFGKIDMDKRIVLSTTATNDVKETSTLIFLR